ncbi:MAG: hypothetical protein PWQ96_623 [Clostridia bacterium]|nr:hypothetical protein [Clostridiales bacterium]MDK2984981.1 hypothetical protein [Clostridia bacterium]
MDLIGIIIFILFVVARAFSETQKKKRQFEERRRRPVSEPELPRFDTKKINELPVDDTTKKVLEDSRPLKKAHKIKEEIEREFEDYRKYKKQRQFEEKKYLKEVKQPVFSEKNRLRPAYKKTRQSSVSPVSGLQFSNDEIVKGIIMSEILQPPRSKRNNTRCR